MTNKQGKTPVDDTLFVDGPPDRKNVFVKGQGLTQRFVALLATRPGEWAKYPNTLSKSGGASVYRDKYPEVEWTTRHDGNGRYTVYGRWIGGK